MRRGFYATLSVLACVLVCAAAAPAQITFIPGPQLSVSNGPAYIAAGDFNGDGTQDAAVAQTISDKVAILLGFDDGTFQLGVSVAVGSNLRGVTTADFNGDRNLDIAVVDYTLNRAFILYGTGKGTFGTPQPFRVDIRGPVSVAAGNFDNGNGPDLVTANGPADTITTLFNQGGNRGLVAQPDIGLGRSSNPKAVATADFNSDGLDDIVVVLSGPRGTDELAYLQNNGVGSFQSVNPVKILIGKGGKALVVRDFNNDGIPDIAVLNAGAILPNTFTISILLDGTSVTSTGKVIGTGIFRSLPAFPITCPPQVNGIPVDCTPQDIKAADFDGDGFNDLAVSFSTAAVDNTSVTAGFVSAYAGRGDGSFDFGTQVLVGLSPRQIAAADFTGDRLPDIAVTELRNNTVRILRSVAPPKKKLGQPCNGPTACDSNFCVNGVCCETGPNCPNGQFCNIPGSTGHCSPPGSSGNPCPDGPQQCDPTLSCVDGFCCNSPACTDGTFCNTGDCGQPAGNGTPCSDPAQCSSGNCVDGICCDSPACPFNEFCDISGFLGTCSPPGGVGVPCTDDHQCQSGFCTDNVCCQSETCAAGLACNVPDHLGSCVVKPTQTPTFTRTPTPTLTPTPQPNGASCTSPFQCSSGVCIDGVCCNMPLGSTSCPTGQACNVSGHVGQCSEQLPNGQPCSHDADCLTGNCQPGNPSVCAPARTATPTSTPTQTRTPTPIPAGGNCLPGQQCENGFICNTAEHVCCDFQVCPQAGQQCHFVGHEGFCSFPPPTSTPTQTPIPTATRVQEGSTCDPNNPDGATPVSAPTTCAATPRRATRRCAATSPVRKGRARRRSANRVRRATRTRTAPTR